MNQIDLSRVDLNLLTLFEVVFEELHVGRSAQRLSLSPSAISHGLSRLRRLFNDPLFAPHPKGLNPTERARALAEPVGEILNRARSLVQQAEPFDPQRSSRRFLLGAVDAIASVIIPKLEARLRAASSTVAIGVRQIFPQEAVAALDGGLIEAALVPPMGWPARCEARSLYVEDFVIAAKGGHRLGQSPTLEDYAAASHLLVSADGSTRGFVDDVIEGHGSARTVSVVVPSFLLALAVLSETDLVCAMPRTLVAAHGARFGVVAIEPPIQLRSDPIEVVFTAASLKDPAMQWILGEIQECGRRAPLHWPNGA